jgi:hypothetical protein
MENITLTTWDADSYILDATYALDHKVFTLLFVFFSVLCAVISLHRITWTKLMYTKWRTPTLAVLISNSLIPLSLSLSLYVCL